MDLSKHIKYQISNINGNANYYIMILARKPIDSEQVVLRCRPLQNLQSQLKTT